MAAQLEKARKDPDGNINSGGCHRQQPIGHAGSQVADCAPSKTTIQTKTCMPPMGCATFFLCTMPAHPNALSQASPLPPITPVNLIISIGLIRPSQGADVYSIPGCLTLHHCLMQSAKPNDDSGKKDFKNRTTLYWA